LKRPVARIGAIMPRMASMPLLLPPAVIVHGAAELAPILALGRRFTLLSAPGAALYAGCAWWRALAEAARARAPDLLAADILDCADAAGRALAALRLGQTFVVLWPETPGRAAVAAVAEAQGAVLLPQAPPACDLGAHDGLFRLPAWLGRP
jgi:hypothetical protein